MTLDWTKIQEKWQKRWQKADLGKATIQKNKDKFFMIFAYPGISGYLHVGHMRGFSYTDAICRYERLKGKEVLFPVGTHASGNQAIAFANKVKKNDPDWISYLKNNGCSESKIKTLTDPNTVIKYFNEVYVEDYWKKFGFLCDWDRFTCTTFPDYEKFIQWQFQKLMKKNLLVQKPYFATACIEHGPVAVDPSETDIAKGGNAEKVEYTLLKFKIDNEYIVAATLRPETIYGQTNLWINPQTTYVRIQINNENWILSKQAAEKLIHQKENVTIKEDITALTLIGRKALAPGVNREIIILPAAFCDPAVGTGIVTSVPSDAPFDYLALKQLQENDTEIQQYHLDPTEVKNIKPIPIITTKGYGPLPAQEIIEKHNITSFTDPKLEEENKEIYKAGHHTGVLNENCGKYSGKKVEEAKELVKSDLLDQKKADVFHDLSEEVVCRCGNPVVIKRIDDQWFIRYSDQELTERSKEQVKEMRVFPQEYQENLPGILEWFTDRACARLGNWLGSKFPVDKKWTIEPISDSTLYPAYYIVSKFIKNKTIKTEELTEEFFDFVFLSRGKGKEHWKEIQQEFHYFYPLDLNLGGKEHKTVHFPVFIMNHIAILPEEKWPKGIFVNWWVIGKGSKISKSKGGAEPIPNAIEKYGVDAMRLYYAHIGSPHIDVVWTEDVVFNYKNTLERIHTLVEKLQTQKGRRTIIDEWIISRMNQHLVTIEHSMRAYDLRELASTVYFSIYDDLKWYVRRGGNDQKTTSEVISIWARLMNPITPHVSEEIYNQNNQKDLCSTSTWPTINRSAINFQIEAQEKMLLDTMENMRNVITLAKIEAPQKFTLFIAEPWLYELYKTLSREMKSTRNMGEIMKKVLLIEEFTPQSKEISRIVQSALKDPAKIPPFVLSADEEYTFFTGTKKFLEEEFKCTVAIVKAEDSQHSKAKAAQPGKVGILVE